MAIRLFQVAWPAESAISSQHASSDCGAKSRFAALTPFAVICVFLLCWLSVESRSSTEMDFQGLPLNPLGEPETLRPCNSGVRRFGPNVSKRVLFTRGFGA
jgi:hypothetical protein